MPRLMSVSMTVAAVESRTKRVTRRLGWLHARPGDRYTLCEKVQGRRRADGTVEPLVRLVDVEVVSVRRERLDAITAEDVALEGFPGMSPEEFVDRFFVRAQRVAADTIVTRIEWVYLDSPVYPAAVTQALVRT